MEEEFYFYSRKINYKTIPTAYLNPFREYVQSLQRSSTQVGEKTSKFLPASFPDTLIRYSPRRAINKAGKDFMPYLNLIKPIFSWFESNDIPITFLWVRNIYGNTTERLGKPNYAGVKGHTCVWIPLFDYSADHKIIHLYEDNKNIKQISPKATFITNSKYHLGSENTSNNLYSFLCVLTNVKYHEMKAKL